jgi:carbamoyltransferase
MTNANRVKEALREKVQGVLNVDGSCRPQIISDEKTRFGQLLVKMKTLTGLGVLLNTSLNIHGEPLACSPEDTLRAFQDSGADHLFMEDFLVSKN